LKSFYGEMATLMSLLGTNSSADAQSIVDRISEELNSCHSLMEKLYAKIRSTGILTRIWLALSEEKGLVSWRAEMAEHRTAIGALLTSLLVCVTVI
jgi:hypothetical protein